ncbi:hypothetical protein JVU11DRAFT_1206 [Chiua virens]|nr:hypothetical protein JVU11DRAFT_1206 [Chiua virens]
MCSTVTKAKELALAHKRIEQLSVQLTELDSVRQQLHDTLALEEDRERMVVALKDQLKQWKGTDSARLEKLRRTRAELEEVWRKLPSTPTMKEPAPDSECTTQAESVN